MLPLDLPFKRSKLANERPLSCEILTLGIGPKPFDSKPYQPRHKLDPGHDKVEKRRSCVSGSQHWFGEMLSQPEPEIVEEG
jgi:hypothetical protein